MGKNRVAGPATRMRGVLIPTGWDDNGRPIELTLADFAEKEYRIAPTADLRNLTGYLRREVNVTGRLTRDPQGRPMLEVHTCEPVSRSI
jgi:hypothetical protein